MIEINLLPEELKIKTKGHSPEQDDLKSSFALIKEQAFLYAIPVLLILLIVIHSYFAIILLSKNRQLMLLDRKWRGLAEQKKELDAFNQEFSVNPQDANLIAQLSRRRVLWAKKLNELSLQLPSGVWFNGIILKGNSLTIKGSVVSLEKEEVSLINRLLDNLKTTPEFSKDLSSLELSSVQKRSIGGYDIADFTLVGALKSK